VPLEIEPDEAERELIGDTIELVESVVRRDGTVPIKIIAPGWGTQRLLLADVIKESGPQAFPAGTQMFWDHPTATEESTGPNAALRDLAGVSPPTPTGRRRARRARACTPTRRCSPTTSPSRRRARPAHRCERSARDGQGASRRGRRQRGLIIDEIVAAKSSISSPPPVRAAKCCSCSKQYGAASPSNRRRPHG
jgi:hypothetical protein